ncbi:MAG: cryptochrome/photolyase family protein [Betaproteobacteria bacterium]|nr:MAG: cryptochrome/photolyase family protein [Betaproteobacteria bacterium]
MSKLAAVRNLVLILGDQLDEASAAFDGFDPAQDRVVMIEAVEESTHVWSHKARIALFLSAMRHFSLVIESRGWPVDYRKLDVENDDSLASGLEVLIDTYQVKGVILVEPGDMRVRNSLIDLVTKKGCTTEIRADRHFICSIDQFKRWAGTSKTLRMEFFYRDMRKRSGVLMEDEKPIGGQWNYDAENRKSFGKSGPQDVPMPPMFAPDAITRDVIAMVESRFSDHPGATAHFNWPVTRDDALIALRNFIEHRLAEFGPHQDAMWTTLHFGWHSLLSTSLNLKLLNPREVIAAAEAAFKARRVDLASAEGFIRQILGWREFMRGVYFLDMPAMKAANHFGHKNALPKWYWNGQTQMNCLKHCVNQTLDYGYAHHIQRLMITGMFGVTAQIEPQQLCDWYLSVYVDAIEWVELPNTAGMALFANGGRFTSKPYVASGAYVKRMSNYCDGCRYRPDQKTGANACPLTTLYWNFLDTHEASFASNPRTALMVKNLQRMTDEERAVIRGEAKRLLSDLDAL